MQPLIRNGTEGVPQALAALQNYDLVKEDLESLLELSQWPDKKDPMSLIESKVSINYNNTYAICAVFEVSIYDGFNQNNG